MCLRDFVEPPSTTSPTLTLEFSSVIKVCDFSKFSQFLQLSAILDISLDEPGKGERPVPLQPLKGNPLRLLPCFPLRITYCAYHYDVKCCMFPLLARPSRRSLAPEFPLPDTCLTPATQATSKVVFTGRQNCYNKGRVCSPKVLA